MKKFLIMALTLILATAYAGEVFAEKQTIGIVVKAIGHAWFERMRQGVERFSRDTGHETLFLGPAKPLPAEQAKLVEKLTDKGVDAICVIPFAPQVLEPALKNAMDKGIVVITHEAVNQQNMHYDIEAFDNAAYGAHLMDHLAKYMGREGDYLITVASLLSKSHNQWADAAIRRQKEKYPKMRLAADKILDYDDEKIAYQKIKRALRQYPNLRGIQGSAMPTVPGASRAVEELGLQDKVAVVGTGLVSVAGHYLESGTAKVISCWDPADAGYALGKLAIRVLERGKMADGMDLGIKGYNNIRVKGRILYGSAWIDITRENMKDHDF